MTSRTQTSLQRKRARDRNAQRNARERRELYIHQLQQQVAFCRAHHGDHPHQHDSFSMPAGSPTIDQPSELVARDDAPFPGVGAFQLDAPGAANSAPQSQALTEMRLHAPAELPLPLPMALQWSIKPLSDPTDALGQIWSPWLSCPDVMSLLPETPRPRDLLLGTKKNPVTNAIHIALSRFDCYREIEIVAIGWLIYLYTKWITAPTHQRYLRMPDFLRLTPLQIHCKHAAPIDGIIFPQIRDNMIRHMLDDDLEGVFTLFSASQKLRWSNVDDMFVKKDSRAVDINPLFVDTFMVLENWYMEPAFGERYPHLVQGLDPCYQPQLHELSYG